jgi:hypothetical protein
MQESKPKDTKRKVDHVNSYTRQSVHLFMRVKRIYCDWPIANFANSNEFEIYRAAHNQKPRYACQSFSSQCTLEMGWVSIEDQMRYKLQVARLGLSVFNLFLLHG